MTDAILTVAVADIRDELKRFNEWRRDTFKRWPTPDDPLPMAPTERGGDTSPPERGSPR